MATGKNRMLDFGGDDVADDLVVLRFFAVNKE
jgi:hypothetical protein